MQIKVQGINVNYIQYGSDRYRITIIDFPGFGNSEEPKEPWTIDQYSLMLENFVKQVGIKKPIVMGHSFGGRVAIRYSARNNIEKLVLFGSPCIRVQEELPLKVRLLKKMKTLPGMNKIGEYMKQFIGSRDYKAASPIMRETLVNVVNEDLSKYAREIEEPTLLIWGEQDTEAPVNDARELEKIMMDAALIIVPGTHYAYLENLARVITILNSFI